MPFGTWSNDNSNRRFRIIKSSFPPINQHEQVVGNFPYHALVKKKKKKSQEK